jgi:hypothetical protein
VSFSVAGSNSVAQVSVILRIRNRNLLGRCTSIDDGGQQVQFHRVFIFTIFDVIVDLTVLIQLTHAVIN